MQTPATNKGKKTSLMDRPIFRSDTFPKFLPLLLLIDAALSGILPQPLVALIAVGIMFFMTFANNLYLAFPVMLFYYIQLDTFLGVSVFRIFVLLFLFSLLSHRRIQFKEQMYFLPLAVYILYLAFSLSFHNVRTAAFFGLDVIAILLLIFQHLRDKDKFRAFFTIYALTALLAFLTGLIVGVELDSYMQSDGTIINRLMATFNDPNYTGFFYSIAIFATVALKLFTKAWRIIIVIALYIMLLASLSMTAIIGNVLFWVVYLIAFKKLSRKTNLWILGIAAALIGLYFLGLAFTDIPLLGSVSMRIQEKIVALSDNDLNAFTTNRLHLLQQAWSFYISQDSILRILFGGHLANALVYNMPYGNVAAHNEYVDLLINVGLLGTVILIGFVVLSTATLYRRWKKSRDTIDECSFMTKIIWMYYAATLTLFGDIRFLFFFFL